MKRKILLLVVLVALILTGCSKGNENENENENESENKNEPIALPFETRQECSGEHIEVDIPDEPFYRDSYFVFYNDENGNNVVVEKCAEHHSPIKLQSYADPHFTREDFYKLNVGMSIYEIVEMVGLPCRRVTSGAWTSDFLMDDGNYVRVYWTYPMYATSFHYIGVAD